MPASSCWPIMDEGAENNTTSYYVASCLLVVYVEPCMCCLGFTLNIICIGVFFTVVMTKRGYCRKVSLIQYLIALCIFDAVQLFLAIFVIVMPATEQYIQLGQPAIAYQLKRVNVYTIRIFYPLLMAASYASIWTIIVICLQRYQAVCYPLATVRRRFQIIRYSKTTITIVAVCAMAINAIRFGEMRWSVNDQNYTELASTALHKSPEYGLMVDVSYVMFTYVLPFILLGTMNVKILLTIHAQRKSIPLERLSHGMRSEHRSAFMVLTIIVLFFSCRTLSFALRFMKHLHPNLLRTQEPDDFIWFAQDMNNFLINLNSCCNPIVYFCFTRKFKDLFFEIRHGSQASLREAQVLLLLNAKRTSCRRHKWSVRYVQTGRRSGHGQNVKTELVTVTANV